MALFQGKIQVEKSGGNLAHIRCVTPTTTPPTAQHNISHKQAISLQLQCFHEAWARFEKKVPTLGGDSGEHGGEPRGARWGATWSSPRESGGEQHGAAPGSRVENPGERGGEQCGGTPSGSHNGTKRKSEAHTQGTQTAQGQFLPSSFTPHACHGRQARHQRHHQTPHDPHLAMPPHAHSCDFRNVGGRICVMVARHSWCFVSVLRVP